MSASKTTPPSLDTLIVELGALAERIAQAEGANDDRAKLRARGALAKLTRQLAGLTEKLDPVRRPTSLFDPADPATAGRIVALALVAQPKHPLAEVPAFYGSGVYAIYYTGPFEAYRQLVGVEHPIYAGKADPNSPSAKDAVNQGAKISGRLREHAKSTRAASSTLNIDDFQCRFLIVQSGFQSSAEGYLINFFKPIWNSETKICFGIGKHGDAATTRGNKRSPWDTMHPGRKWAAPSAEDQKPFDQVVREISAHLKAYPPYADIHEIFDRFILDMRQLQPKP